MKWLKVLVIIIVSFVILVIAAVSFIPKDKIINLAVVNLEAEIGRTVTISPDSNLTFWPHLGVSVTDFSIANAEWAEGQFVSADLANIAVSVVKLLSGEIVIEHVTLINPKINWTTNSNGKGNWEFANINSTQDSDNSQTISETTSAKETQNELSHIPAITIAELRIENGSINFQAYKKDPLRIDNLNATIALDPLAQTMDIGIDLNLNNEPITTDIVFTNLILNSKNLSADMDIKISSPNGKASFFGQLNSLDKIQGSLKINSPDTEQFLSGFGINDITIPTGFGQQMDVTTQLQIKQLKHLLFGNLMVDLHGNTISGELAIALQERPFISGKIDLRNLDLRGITQTDEEANSDVNSTTSADTEGWSTQAIDASALGLINANLNISMDSINTGTIVIGTLNGNLSIKKARAQLTITKMHAYEGKGAGTLMFSATNPMQTSGKFIMDNLSVGAILDDALGIDKIHTQGQLQTSFQTSGNNIDALVRNLSGKGDFLFDKGKFVGIDLDQLISSGKVDSGTTLFNNMSASYTITKGKLHNNDLLFNLPKLKIYGTGWVDAGTRTLNYDLEPTLKPGASAGLSIPLKIHGTWQAPQFTPNFDGAIDFSVKQELNKIKEEAKAQVEQKVKEKQQELEEKAKQRLQDELSESAGAVLQGLFN